MTPQDTMRLALEALEYASTGNRRPEIIGPAIDALRSALAQQGEQQPVGYQWMGTHHFRVKLPKDAEKYAWRPVYAGAAPAAQPLSIEEIEQINAQWNYEIHGDRTRYIARMVEQAHGIGVQK